MLLVSYVQFPQNYFRYFEAEEGCSDTRGRLLSLFSFYSRGSSHCPGLVQAVWKRDRLASCEFWVIYGSEMPAACPIRPTHQYALNSITKRSNKYGSKLLIGLAHIAISLFSPHRLFHLLFWCHVVEREERV